LWGRVPPCQTCFPGINRNNLDAWEVYQKACAEDSMGISAYGIEMACNDLEVSDRLECKMKVKEFISELRRVEEMERDKTKNAPPLQIPEDKMKVFGG
jgi:hypothetical protein